MMVFLISTVCFGTWQKITPAYHTKKEKSNQEFRKDNQGKYPTIETDEVIYADYQNAKFNFRDYIRAKDWNGRDLTDRVHVYGSVDVFQKGIYKLRCVVVSDSQLACTKYVNVIVE
jgi:hypothetical protein